MVQEYKVLIGGEWTDAATGQMIEVVDPASGEVIGRVPKCGIEEVDRAVFPEG